MYRKLGVVAPMEICSFRSASTSLLVAVALADGGSLGRLQGDVGELLTAFRAFGMCVNLLAIRRKIRVALGAERHRCRPATADSDVSSSRTAARFVEHVLVLRVARDQRRFPSLSATTNSKPRDSGRW
jgi:hypothetical protein